MEQNSAIAAHLKDSRTKAGLTQEATAAALSCLDKRTLQRYENGEVEAPAESIIALSEVYKDTALPVICLAEHELWKHTMPAFECNDPRAAAAQLLEVILESADNQRLFLRKAAGNSTSDQERNILHDLVKRITSASLALIMQDEERR